jgi:hypothetical protein
VIQHDKVGELGLTDHHLGHRAPVGQFVVSQCLRQPIEGVHAGHHCSDRHIARSRAVGVTGSHANTGVVDRPADGLGFQPLRQVHDDPVDAAAAVQFAQQDQQVVADRAGHTAVSHLQSVLGGDQFAVPQGDHGPSHDVAVESVLDDQRPQPA